MDYRLEAMQKSKPELSLSIVIPVFNAEKTISDLVHTLEKEIAKTTSQFEIILVDDNSQDGSAEKIRLLAEKSNRLTGLFLSKNFGQHNALLCGIREAKYDYIITMDDDFQHQPSQIIKLLTSFDDDTDVVYGVEEKRSHGFFRNVASFLVKFTLSRLFGVKHADSIGSFRMFKTGLREGFSKINGPYVNIDVLLSWVAGKYTYVKFDHNTRQYGKSNYTLKSLFKMLLILVTGYSIAPLRFASYLGLFFTFTGMGLLVYIIGAYLFFSGAPEGFTFLATVLSLFSGLIMYILGIIGEYLGRTHITLQGRPLYHVSDRTNTKKETEYE